jgi:shikimate kinase
MIVVLMGYMGSGKSTIGKELATLLKFNFLDLDDYISEREKTSISDIFSNKGEIYFRKKEAIYLREILNTDDDIVLALGGGTPCYAQNLSIINSSSNVLSIYLKLSIPLLSKRLFVERHKRPLLSHLNSEEELAEFIGKHLFERVQYYNEAQHTINTDNKTLQDILEDILMRLI